LSFWEGIRLAWDSAVGAIGGAVSGAGAATQNAWDAVKSYFLTFWEGIQAAWDSAIAAIGDAVSGVGDTIMAPFRPAFGWIGEQIDWIQGKWAGFKGVFGFGGAATAAVGGVAATPGRPPKKGEARKPERARTPGHAAGGVFDKPHIAAFAEGGKEEAAIPLEENLSRARSIWAYSGQKLGMLADGRASAPPSGSSVYIAQGAINITAPPGMDVNALASEVIRRIEKIAQQRRGRTFSDAAFSR
jgi:hypothetical protein